MNNKNHNLFKKIYCKNICLFYFILIPIILVVINGFEYHAFSGLSKEPYKEESLQTGRFNNEKFFYEIYWLGIYAGKAVLETSFDKDILRISSRANSAPFISTFYTVEDYAESLVRDGKAVHFKIKQREGRYRSNKETIFDINNKKIIYFDYLKSKKKEHSLNSTVWDVISGFFYLRTQPLIIGKAFYINVFDSNKFLKAEVSVLRKERIKVNSLGEVATIVIKPDLKSEGLFHRKGDIFIWLTDDEKRIPVKIETKVPIGKIVAELKSF
jgi:hypothetical protein